MGKHKKRSNGESTYRQRPNGTWEVRYTAEYDPETRKAEQRSLYGKTKAEVTAKLTNKQKLLQQGYSQEFENLLVSEWMDEYLWKIKKPQVKPKTFTGYEEKIRLYIHPSKLGEMKIQEVRRVHIQMFIEDMTQNNHSAFIIRATYGVLRNAFNEAVRRDILPVSCVKNISLPKADPKPVKILSVEDQRLFMDAIKKHRLEPAFIVAITTGIREGELTALKWDDYDIEKGIISITKNAVRVPKYDVKTHEKTGTQIIVQDTPKTAAGKREIPLLPIAIDALRNHRTKQNIERLKAGTKYVNNGLIFCDEKGRLYDPKTFYTTLRKIMKNKGLGTIRFHALRHTFATRSLEQEMSPKALQSLLGHETPEMVMHYQHILPEQARVEIDKLSAVFQ